MISQRMIEGDIEDRLGEVVSLVARGEVPFGRRVGMTFRVSMWDVSIEELANLQKGYPLIAIVSGDEMLITTEAALGIEVDFSKRKAN